MLHISAALDWMFVRNAQGAVVTRDAFCSCGASYTQQQLTDAQREVARRGAFEYTSPQHARQVVGVALDRDCPDGWVPINCPKCEHVQLGADARAAEAGLLHTHQMSRAEQRAHDVRYEIAEREAMAL